MELKLDVERIAKMSDVFVCTLFKMVSSDEYNISKFFDIILGLSYASKKVLRSVEVMGMITKEQFNEIEQQLANAAKGDIENVIRMYKEKIATIKEIKNVSQSGSNECE